MSSSSSGAAEPVETAETARREAALRDRVQQRLATLDARIGDVLRQVRPPRGVAGEAKGWGF